MISSSENFLEHELFYFSLSIPTFSSGNIILKLYKPNTFTPITKTTQAETLAIE